MDMDDVLHCLGAIQLNPFDRSHRFTLTKCECMSVVECDSERITVKGPIV